MRKTFAALKRKRRSLGAEGIEIILPMPGAGERVSLYTFFVLADSGDERVVIG